jgi:Fe-S cluster assembly ATP-binding protein
MLKPRMAVLDETDTGLDIDALKVVGEGVQSLIGPQKERPGAGGLAVGASSPGLGALVITHYPRILGYIKADFVHVFTDGRIVAEGGSELAQQLEAEGYDRFIPEPEGAVA